jgi:hypothetical protein
MAILLFMGSWPQNSIDLNFEILIPYLPVNLFRLWNSVFNLISDFYISHPNVISFMYILYKAGDTYLR